MNKKIITCGSVLAVVILVLASFPSVVSMRITETNINKRKSPFQELKNIVNEDDGISENIRVLSNTGIPEMIFLIIAWTLLLIHDILVYYLN